MKILTTQLTGLFQRIGKQEEAIEDTARVLAQAAIGEGIIYLAAFGEMEAVAATALDGAEPLPSAARWQPGTELASADRVWILARNDEGAALAQDLAGQFIPFAYLSAETYDNPDADAFLSLGIDKGLLPDDSGGRTVVPHALAALFVYHAVKMDIDEMLGE
ncbi:DUF2529 family protein [Planococcus lenghuensis]|uniref:DUF2529 domain-containing protein n=1 Tax=Planococcus lenghuensis TaxID=2213202 RepID=A0A1Q2L1L0_9BACL|nr:DUF2529 family protein [Planococcus lenghuensis]AQQ54296.1 hypothetical protein B0X71_15115 [Planococcus lenghuensis]